MKKYLVFECLSIGLLLAAGVVLFLSLLQSRGSGWVLITNFNQYGEGYLELGLALAGVLTGCVILINKIYQYRRAK